jgi:hypothetical protein
MIQHVLGPVPMVRQSISRFDSVCPREWTLHSVDSVGVTNDGFCQMTLYNSDKTQEVVQL